MFSPKATAALDRLLRCGINPVGCPSGAHTTEASKASSGDREPDVQSRQGGSEATINLVVLADQDQGDADGHDHDHGAPEETAEEIGQGWGHGARTRQLVEADPKQRPRLPTIQARLLRAL